MHDGYKAFGALFEAAPFATPIISDDRAGLNHFFVREEILIAKSADDVLEMLREISPREARDRRTRLAARPRRARRPTSRGGI